MDENTAFVISMFLLLGWIPILAIGSVIKGCIKARTCNKCICHEEEINHD